MADEAPGVLVRCSDRPAYRAQYDNPITGTVAGSGAAPRQHAATRDAAELIGRDLTEHGYGVECALLQSVELDTRAWAEKERSVAFLLSGVLPRRGA